MKIQMFLDFLEVLEAIASGGVLNAEAMRDADTHHAARALLKLLVDAKRLGLSEKDFCAQLQLLTDFKDETIQSIWDFLSKEGRINDYMTSDEYSFRDLEWRVESQVRELLMR